MCSSGAQTAERESWEPGRAAEMGEIEGNMGRQLWAGGSPVQVLHKSTC